MEIIKAKELGRGYSIVLVEGEPTGIGSLMGYDIILRKHNYEVMAISTGCMGLKSGEYWMEVAVQQMQRIMLLVEARDMAYNNVLCYSKTYAMSEAKDGYEDKWKYESEKASMTEKWLVDLSNFWGEKSEKGEIIRNEFDIHEIFAD